MNGVALEATVVAPADAPPAPIGADVVADPDTGVALEATIWFGVRVVLDVETLVGDKCAVVVEMTPDAVPPLIATSRIPPLSELDNLRYSPSVVFVDSTTLDASTDPDVSTGMASAVRLSATNAVGIDTNTGRSGIY